MIRRADERFEIITRIAKTPIRTSLSRYVQSGEGRGPPSQAAIADRDRRAAQPEARDLTGQMLGDPPPERSALYRKQHNIAEPELKSIWDGVNFDDIPE